MNVLVLAAGLPPTEALLRHWLRWCGCTIAVDGGLLPFMRIGHVPDVIVGDMDSCDARQLRYAEENGIERAVLPREKNDTDTYAACELAAERGAEHIALLGGTGLRMDHELSNLMLLKWSLINDVRLTIDDDTQTVEIGVGGFWIYGKVGSTVSLIPVDECAEVTADGLYYPLQKLLLTNSRPRGVSNVFLREKAWIQADRPVYIISNKESTTPPQAAGYVGYKRKN